VTSISLRCRCIDCATATNLILLGLFTLLESIGVGAVVSFYNKAVVLEALVITLFVFLGLTLFTVRRYFDFHPCSLADKRDVSYQFQSKIDFSSLGNYLFTALLVFFFTGLVTLFFPLSRTFDSIYAGLGALIFSGYIVRLTLPTPFCWSQVDDDRVHKLFDTYMIINRLSPDEWVIAVVSLYLDVLNLFLTILRLLNNIQSD
jgi:FtsH-binding integral membrane protein